MAFESLAADAISKASSIDRWGFLPGAKCDCGRELRYKAPTLRLRKDVFITNEAGTWAIKECLVCDCGAAYARGKNTH